MANSRRRTAGAQVEQAIRINSSNSVLTVLLNLWFLLKYDETFCCEFIHLNKNVRMSNNLFAGHLSLKRRLLMLFPGEFIGVRAPHGDGQAGTRGESGLCGG